MNLKSFLPPVSVAEFVSSILVLENFDFKEEFILPLYANGSPTIIFQTANPIKGDKTIGNLTLYGQTVLPDELIFNSSFLLIAYFLYPHSLTSLFNIKASELTNDFMSLANIRQAKAINLNEQLLNESTLNGRMHLINQFIVDLAKKSTVDNSKTIFVTNELMITETASLTDIKRKLNTSERTLERLFDNNVGVSPNMFKRICQFHKAFQQLNKYNFTKLTDVAYGNGFADQSHFIRVFKEFTGLTPSEYLIKSAPYNPKF
jgi:AraC-like DNA-binding protein